mmetsp:Transcript_37106/g.116680  ORF Transcript_37106/g.116680 Transcript_37106/m.116680 type:complete len:285 (-) Transcript_37106:394-1248(-)
MRCCRRARCWWRRCWRRRRCRAGASGCGGRCFCAARRSSWSHPPSGSCRSYTIRSTACSPPTSGEAAAEAEAEAEAAEAAEAAGLGRWCGRDLCRLRLSEARIAWRRRRRSRRRSTRAAPSSRSCKASPSCTHSCPPSPSCLLPTRRCSARRAARRGCRRLSTTRTRRRARLWSCASSERSPGGGRCGCSDARRCRSSCSTRSSTTTFSPAAMLPPPRPRRVGASGVSSQPPAVNRPRRRPRPRARAAAAPQAQGEEGAQGRGARAAKGRRLPRGRARAREEAA